ncbi:MAG TPA: tetratricopeptide repeat protein, partial [Anaerolineae bacterium]|nr:tetratricopeptide repeat protein [Anaerolineae bacterium]
MDNLASEQKQIPHNLPVSPQPFVDREKEIREVTQALLDPYIPLVTVTGIGGIGKTALAQEVAHRLLEQGQFAGGICWLDCWGSDNTLDAILRTIQTTLGLGGTPVVREEVRRYLRTNPCLLVLDGYDAVAQDMELLAFLERMPEPSKALLTSRQDIRLHGWTLALDSLTKQDAVRLFVEAAERHEVEVPSEQNPLVAEICRLVDGVPMAIQLAAAQAASMSLDTLRQRIAQVGLKVPSLEATLRQSYSRLSERAKALFRRLAVFIDGADDKAVENVCQVEGWREAWSELVRFALVREQNRCYSLRAAIQPFALKLLEEAGEREKYEERAAEYFLALAQFGESKLDTDEADIGIAIARNKRGNMLAGQEWYWVHERWEEVIAYGYALDRLLDVAGFWEDRLKVLQRAVEASKRKGDAGEQARLLHNLAILHHELGDYAVALGYYQESLAAFREADDRFNQASALNNLGSTYHVLGQMEKALECYQQALAIWEKQLGPEHPQVAVAVNNLGSVLRDLGDLAGARPYYERALA